MTQRELRIAERVRTACVERMLEAYEDAGIQGLCDEGRLEVAVDAVRTLDLEELIGMEEATGPRPSHPA